MENHTRNETGRSIGLDLVGLALLGIFLFLFFNYDRFKGEEAFFTIPDAWLNVNTIFLSIVIEAIPFILLGVFVSALIQIYVKEDMLQRFIPRNAFAALLPATILGALFPICECAIVPVVRRLIKKGLPQHIGVVFLVAAPILNPVVFASTYFAFRSDLTVLYARMGLAFILAMVIGAILYLFFKNRNPLRWNTEERHSHDTHESSHSKQSTLEKMKATAHHTVDEFFDMGKYLIAGAFIAALFQTFLDRQVLVALGSNEWSSTFVMMMFAYILSLCSEADAFVAASFGTTFTVGSLVAFLVYGPMIDLKNTIMLLAYFNTKFVVVFIATVTVTVFSAVMILQFLL